MPLTSISCGASTVGLSPKKLVWNLFDCLVANRPEITLWVSSGHSAHLSLPVPQLVISSGMRLHVARRPCHVLSHFASTAREELAASQRWPMQLLPAQTYWPLRYCIQSRWFTLWTLLFKFLKILTHSWEWPDFCPVSHCPSLAATRPPAGKTPTGQVPPHTAPPLLALLAPFARAPLPGSLPFQPKAGTHLCASGPGHQPVCALRHCRHSAWRTRRWWMWWSRGWPGWSNAPCWCCPGWRWGSPGSPPARSLHLQSQKRYLWGRVVCQVAAKQLTDQTLWTRPPSHTRDLPPLQVIALPSEVFYCNQFFLLT